MRLRLTGVWLVIGVIGLAILGPLGACAYLHSAQPFNSLHNDTSDKVAWCKGTRFISFGDTVSVRPGQTKEISGKRCSVIPVHDSGYFGCIEVGEAQGQMLLVSSYDPAVDYFDCDGYLQ